VTAPIRNSIELYAVGELHLVLLIKPLELVLLLPAVLYASVIKKLEFLKVCEAVTAGRKSVPSSSEPCRGQSIRIGCPSRATEVCGGGGTP
jgi:hypothetical protein